MIKVLTTDKDSKRNQRVIHFYYKEPESFFFFFCYFSVPVTDSENSKYCLIKNAHCPYLWKPPHGTWSIFPRLPPGMQSTDVFLDSLLAPLGTEKLIYPPEPGADWVLQLLIPFAMSRTNKLITVQNLKFFLIYIKRILGYKFDDKSWFKTIITQRLETILQDSLVFCSPASRGTDSLSSGLSF